MIALRVDYDDGQEDMIRGVNEVLKMRGVGLEFVDDGEEHDGCVMYKLREVEPWPWQKLSSNALLMPSAPEAKRVSKPG